MTSDNKTYVSAVIETFVPFHQALSGNEVVDTLRVVGDKMHQCRLTLCQGWLQERIAIAPQQAPYRIEIQEDLDGFLYSLFPKDDTTCHQTKRYGNPQRALIEHP